MFTQNDTLLTPKVKVIYSDLKLICKTSLYQIYEGKSLYPPNPVHTIRVFDSNSDFAKDDYDRAVTLFIQEMLHLMSINPDCVIVNSFEMSEGGKKMAFATLPYAPISCQIQQGQQFEFSELQSTKEMISDVLLEVDFLSKELGLKDCSSILTPQSIYRFKDSGICFLGDWATPVIREKAVETTLTNTMTTTLPLHSIPNISKEILSLGLSVLELNGVASKVVNGLKERGADDVLYDISVGGILGNGLGHISKELRSLLERMLSKNEDSRPKINEFALSDNARRKKNPTGNIGQVNLEKSDLADEDLAYLIKNVMENAVIIKHLNLKDNKLSEKAAAELSANSTWTSLTTLDLSLNKIGDQGAAALSENKSWAKLTTLNLSENEISAEGAKALSSNNSWLNLATLNLSGNNIGTEGIAVLKAKWPEVKLIY